MAQAPTDYLALAVDRLADSVQALQKEIREVKEWQAKHDAVEGERKRREMPFQVAFWRILAAAAIGVGAWTLKLLIAAAEMMLPPKK